MLRTKILMLLLVLLVSAVSFVAYLHREQAKVNRPLRPDEKQTLDSLSGWGKSLQDQKSK